MSKPRTHFVFVLPCGCPTSLVDGSAASTADKDWDLIAANRAEERRMRDQGITVVQVTHDEYKARFYPLMTQQCPHVPEADRV